MNSDNTQVNNILHVQKISEQEKEKIMKEIEKNAENKVIDAAKTGKIYSPLDAVFGIRPQEEETKKTINTLMDIMQTGANEFESKVGRPMTYAEMRSMFG